jgi:hypothetical protein
MKDGVGEMEEGGGMDDGEREMERMELSRAMGSSCGGGGAACPGNGA